jgi:hypothetical protein
LNVHILAYTSVPCRPTTVPMPKFAVIETKGFTGQFLKSNIHISKNGITEFTIRRYPF